MLELPRVALPDQWENSHPSHRTDAKGMGMASIVEDSSNLGDEAHDEPGDLGPAQPRATSASRPVRVDGSRCGARGQRRPRGQPAQAAASTAPSRAGCRRRPDAEQLATDRAGGSARPRPPQGRSCALKNPTILAGAHAGYTCPPGWMKVLTGTGPFADG